MAATAAVVLIGFLAFRIVDLEQRVASISRQLDAAAPASETEDAGTSPNDTHGSGYEHRIRALEKRVHELEAKALVRDRPAPLANDPQTENAVLSVVEREQSRIRDVQLEFHRGHWIQQRNAALTVFAQTYGLSTEQVVEIQKALEQEVDAMVDQLRRPTLLEDPDQAASDWQTMLDDTDARARKVLTPEQLAAWEKGRLFERQVLWPWLRSPLNKP
jgi:HAMP domain-containing protein